jgi:methylthioribose-1-phosphate isomerase
VRKLIKKDDIIIVGSDALRNEGVVNKVGTYMLALAAREIQYLLCCIINYEDRPQEKIEIEMRNASEVCKINCKCFCAESGI